MTTSEGTRAIVVRMEGAASPDIGMLDALARMQLAALRAGWTIRVATACPELRELVELAGLAEVLALEALGEPEDREELRVQEVVEPGDPVT